MSAEPSTRPDSAIGGSLPPAGPESTAEGSEGLAARARVDRFVSMLPVLASLALLTWYAGKGRNWARLIHVLWLVLSIALVVAATLVMRSLAAKLGGTGKEMPAFFGPWEAFDTVLVAAALILLYTPAANTWYRAVKASRKA